jgi:alpha-beta hydrolase superfamily lysophospholipase
MDALQTRVERMGTGMVDRLQGLGSRLKSSAAVSNARKAVRRGSEQTATWVKKNPRALPVLGLSLGGAMAMLLLRARRKARQPKLLQGAMKAASALPLKKGLGMAFGRFLGWALSPRKPHVFRAITIKW